ncbi:hypothetical protein [Streptomyces sp. NPDC013740]|uniref:hypothetical protein n=1 Tax=Streptomyces sp. NPDC013740 TaxID=3364867 RepID=UPI0036FD0131
MDATTALLLAAEIAERFKPFGALGLAPEVSRPQTVDKAVIALPVLLPTETGGGENSKKIDQIRQAASSTSPRH